MALGTHVSDPATDGAQIDAFAGVTGQQPAMIMWYQSWSEPLFYPEQLTEIAARDATPMVTWLPTFDDGPIPLRSIASGAHDPYLKEAARSAAASGAPLFVRFAHEMNGHWYAWGRRAGQSDRDYVAAWRHVVDLFRAEGATNVRWVWSPNVTEPGGDLEFASLYPGDEWVDWVALDGYNWGSLKESGWRDFEKLFGYSYDVMTRLTDKPLMIGETASTELGGDKARWISDAFDRVLPQRLPRVRAVVWFDRDKETDWRVDSSSQARAAAGRIGPSRAASLGRDTLEDPTSAPLPEIVAEIAGFLGSA